MKVQLSDELLSKLHLFDECKITNAYVMLANETIVALVVDAECTNSEDSGRTIFALG